MDGYSVAQVLLLLLAAGLVGFAKTSIGGVASISVAIFAAVMPARQSTGALLPLLMVGDVFAVTAYRAHAHWRVLVRLAPTVVVGIVAGAWFVSHVDDLVMRRTIGAVLLGLVAVNLWTRSRQQAARRRAREAAALGTPTNGLSLAEPPVGPTDAMGATDAHIAADASPSERSPERSPVRRRAEGALYGALTGFTTMVANAGGPVMSLYMLSMRMPMLAFLGTGAWLFAVFNAVKVPFMVGLGLLTWKSLVLDALLVPALLVGALVGRRVVRHLDQVRFERVVLVVTVLSALNLLR